MSDACGGELHAMEGQFEESEMIDVVEVSYRVVAGRSSRSTRAGAAAASKTAPGPERAVAGGRYSLDVAIKVVHRQVPRPHPARATGAILAQHGLVVTPQTLWDQLYAVAQRLDDHRRALDDARAGAAGDRSRSDGLAAARRRGRPSRGRCGASPRRASSSTASATTRAPRRSGSSSDGTQGVIVCDALKTHGAGARGLAEDRARRMLGSRLQKVRERPSPIIPRPSSRSKWIGELYEIDARADGDLDALAELRRTESAAVLAELKTWLWEQATLKTLSIGNAAGYVIANWDRLTRFVEDPRIPLDNNATERGDPRAGRRATRITTARSHAAARRSRRSSTASIETAKLHDIDPATYLRAAVLAADRGEVLLPWDMRVIFAGSCVLVWPHSSGIEDKKLSTRLRSHSQFIAFSMHSISLRSGTRNCWCCGMVLWRVE